MSQNPYWLWQGSLKKSGVTFIFFLQNFALFLWDDMGNFIGLSLYHMFLQPMMQSGLICC